MTIRTKIILANIIVFGIILFAVAVVVYNRTLESETARIDSRLDTFAVGFITEFEDEWENNEFPDSDEMDLIGTDHQSDIRIQLLDNTGKVLFQRGELPSLPASIVRFVSNNSNLWQNIIIGHEPFRRFARPVEIEDHDNFVLVLAASTEEMEDRLESLTLVLIFSLAGALLLSVLAVYFITGRAFRPLIRMVETAETISASTLHRRLDEPSTRDEVGRLTSAFNDMMRRIEAAFKSQRQFVADASHELRTPLTIVIGELEFLKRQIDDGQLNDSINTVLHEMDRLTHLIQELLLLARIDAQKLPIDKKTVRLDEILAECIRLQLPSAAARNVQIDLHIDDAIEIYGDTEYIRRAFINIIDNAVKYSPDGGKVAVALRSEEENGIVTIDDQGPGIDPSDIELVFKRFYRSPKARQMHDGSGLGLAIAKELIEAHGGKIELAGAESVGTRVIIRLPFGGPTDSISD